MTREKFLLRALRVLTCLAALIVSALYLYFWNVGYNSDFAITGLAAKRILEHGEHPIYIWNIGHQGLLLSAHAVALFFLIFGISPYSLNIAPTLFFLGGLFLFYKSVGRVYGERAALFSTLILSVGSPGFFAAALRTYPNFAETFLFGMALIHISSILTERLYVRGKKAVREDHLLFATFGFLAGFGLYAYGLILYFVAAALSPIVLIYFREARKQPPKGRWQLVFRALNSIALLTISLGFLALLSGITEITPFAHKIKSDPIATIEFGFLILGAAHLFKGFRLFYKTIFRFRALLLTGLGSAFLGYLPKLYYQHILKLPSPMDNLGMGGTLADIVFRLKIGARGLGGMLNLTPWTLFSAALALALALAIGFSFFRTYQQLSRFSHGQGEPKNILKLSPLFSFFIFIPVFFLAANAVLDLGSTRYMLYLFPALAMALGYSLDMVMERFDAKTVFAGLFFVLFLLNNTNRIYADLRSSSRPTTSQKLIVWFKNHDLKYGYGDYWQSYSTTFLSREEIVIEPLKSAYIPFYAKAVSEAPRIGYVVPTPEAPPRSARQIAVSGRTYRIVDRGEIDGLAILSLRKF